MLAVCPIISVGRAGTPADGRHSMSLEITLQTVEPVGADVKSQPFALGLEMPFQVALIEGSKLAFEPAERLAATGTPSQKAGLQLLDTLAGIVRRPLQDELALPGGPRGVNHTEVKEA
jgi:hypothetical protein